MPHLYALLMTAMAPSLAAQANDAPRNNGDDVTFFYGDPSWGAPLGTLPPDVTGDLFWTVHTGEDHLAYADPGGFARMEIAGYYEELFDTGWTTSPRFYVRTHGPVLPGALGPAFLKPAFFELGLTSEVVVDLGPSGFGSPCTIAPSLCTGCPTPFASGWTVDVQFASGAGVLVGSLGTSASDLATTWFLHGGMVATGGLCGMGDYTLQDVHSTNETAADPTGAGVNPWGGFQFLGQGPLYESITSTVGNVVTWREPILNPVADSGTGLGLEDDDNGGGALNGYLLGVSGGGARLAVEVRDLVGAGVPGNLAFVGASLATLAVPGAAFLGAQVLVQPDSLFALTVKAWQGSVTPVVFEFPEEGAFRTVPFDMPPALTGTALYLQGLTLDPATLIARTTNRVRVRLL